MRPESPFVGHEFGGSSFGGSDLADAERVRHVAGALAARPEKRKVVVAPALREVTGDLLKLVATVADPDDEWLRTASGAPVARPDSHPFANFKPTDNVVQFTTDRYGENPQVVQGAGAGPEIRGGFADLLQVASALGAPL